MAYRDINRDMVLLSLQEFDRLGRDVMLERYSSGPSGKSICWYICHKGKHYDQKLILRAAHKLSGLGPLPSGRGTFTAGEARRHLGKLGFQVVRKGP